MNILHVIPSLSIRNGGPSFFQTALCHALEEQGQSVSIFTTSASAPASSEESKRWIQNSELPEDAAGLDIRIFPIRQPYRFAHSPALARAIHTYANEYDVIHIHSLNLHPQFTAWTGATKHRIPYVVTPHGVLNPYIRSHAKFRKAVNDRLWQKRMLRGSSAIHVTSETEASYVAALGYQKISIIPIGIDLDRFQYDRDQLFRRQELATIPGPIILNHGRLAEKKQLDILIYCMPTILSAYPEAHLVLIGADEGQWTKLAELAESLGVRQHLSHFSSLSGENLVSGISAGDVWVLPSADENFGMAVLEAMAVGLPTIISPNVGLAGDVAANSAGIVVSPTPELTANAILTVLSNAERSAQLRSAGPEFAQRYSWHSIGAQFVDLYRSIATGHSGSGLMKRGPKHQKPTCCLDVDKND